MPTFTVHTLVLPVDPQQQRDTQQSRPTSVLSAVSSGPGSVLPVGAEPGERRLRGLYRGQYAEKMGRELEELTGSNDIDEVALYSDAGSPDDGYYTLSNAQVQPVRTQSTNIQRWAVTLVSKGARRTHWRAVTTAPSTPSGGNDFGTDTTGYIGAPSNATRPRWFDPEGVQLENATVVETRNGRFADVDVYDAQNSSFTDPVLIYDIPYDEEGQVDTRVYDDRGTANRTDTDGNLQWQRVFDPGHEPEGTFYVESGIHRLEFDETNTTLNAWDWNDTSSAWESQTLGTSNWSLREVDLTAIDLAVARAQVEFQNTSASPTDYYSLDMVLERAQDNASWFVPDNEPNSTPGGLQTLLTPIADTTDIDPQPSKTVETRDNTRL